jgi:hypothetical protein
MTAPRSDEVRYRARTSETFRNSRVIKRKHPLQEFWQLVSLERGVANENRRRGCGCVQGKRCHHGSRSGLSCALRRAAYSRRRRGGSDTRQCGEERPRILLGVPWALLPRRRKTWACCAPTEPNKDQLTSLLDHGICAVWVRGRHLHTQSTC